METVDISKIASVGKVTAMAVNVGVNGSANNSNGGNGGGSDTETEEAKTARLQQEADAKEYEGLSADEITAKKEEKRIAAETAEKNKLPELNDEQLKALFKQTFGDDFTGNIDDLKAKLKVPATAAVITPEEQLKIDAEWDKKQLDLYVSTGGTIESYAAMKNILAMDLTELSKADIKRELKAADFSDDAIEKILQERYYQLNPDELQQGADELDTDFEARKASLKKKIEYGTTKLANRGTSIKAKAESTLKNLRLAIEQSDKQKLELEKEETNILSTVDEVFSKIPKKETFELGESNGKKLEPVEYEVTDADIAEVANSLKDKTARNNILFKEDGDLDYTKVAKVLLRNKILESAVKTAYLQGDSRATEFFYSKFGGQQPKDIGIGSNGNKQNGQPGKIVSAGTPQPAKRPVLQ